MNAGHILDALEMIDDQYILEARDRNSLTSVKKSRSMRRAPDPWPAVIIALLFPLALPRINSEGFDPWLQEPSASPTETVQSAIESQIHKDYTIGVRVRKIRIDKDETARVAAMYTGSELAAERVGRTSILPATLWLYGQNMMWSTTIPKPFWTTAIRSSIFT